MLRKLSASFSMSKSFKIFLYSIKFNFWLINQFERFELLFQKTKIKAFGSFYFIYNQLKNNLQAQEYCWEDSKNLNIKIEKNL